MNKTELIGELCRLLQNRSEKEIKLVLELVKTFLEACDENKRYPDQ